MSLILFLHRAMSLPHQEVAQFTAAARSTYYTTITLLPAFVKFFSSSLRLMIGKESLGEKEVAGNWQGRAAKQSKKNKEMEKRHCPKHTGTYCSDEVIKEFSYSISPRLPSMLYTLL